MFYLFISVWKRCFVFAFVFPCSEGIVANLCYLQSRRKTRIIYGTYVKAYFIQPTMCMRFFCRFIRFFYPGQTVCKRSCMFQLKSLKKFIFVHISSITSIQDQWFNLFFVVARVQGLHWQINPGITPAIEIKATQTLTAVSLATTARRECCGSSLSCQEQNDTSFPPKVLDICSYCHLIRLCHDLAASVCE